MADSSGLADFVSKLAPKGSLRVEENLGAGFVRLRISEAEARQAKQDIRCVEDAVVELLRNSRDAGATRIFVASSREGSVRTLTIIDDGQGIPSELHDRIFDARVTSKLDTMHEDRWGVNGRGIALFSIRENARSAKVIDSAEGLGSSIQVVFDVDELDERADQSSWPRIGRDDDGQTAVTRGPHNIIRSCCEFALEEQGELSVYLGSPAEIAATMRSRVVPAKGEASRLFVDDVAKLPLIERPGAAADASELMECCCAMGLEMSERTAHRILAGQIKPMRNVLARLRHDADALEGGGVDLLKDRRGLRISEDDLEAFSRIMERDFDYLADRYYLALSSDPVVRISGSKLSVSFEIEKLD